MEDAIRRARRIRLVVFDVDGVLTDGSLYLGEGGVEYKAFFSRDGHGMKMLMNSGVQVAVLTGRSSRVVSDRMASLGIAHVYQGQTEKLPVFQQLLRTLDLSAEQAAFVGDDVLDLPPMREAGLAIAVADAHPLVIRHSHWQAPSRGGRGAAREICEWLMEVQGTLDAQLALYLGPASSADAAS